MLPLLSTPYYTYTEVTFKPGLGDRWGFKKHTAGLPALA